MAGQGMDRREVLRIMALAAGAAQFPGFSRWVFACGHVGAGLAQPRPARYQPQFFSPDEYATVERLAELIIPSEDSPGAREAGVSEFIDFMAASDPSVQFQFRYGLTWLDSHSDTLYGKPFRELETAQQTEILDHLACRDRRRAGEEGGQAFFNLMREYTVMGFYTSRVGLEQLDYPGLKLYTESPGCPHEGNPEHRHL